MSESYRKDYEALEARIRERLRREAENLVAGHDRYSDVKQIIMRRVRATAEIIRDLPTPDEFEAIEKGGKAGTGAIETWIDRILGLNPPARKPKQRKKK